MLRMSPTAAYRASLVEWSELLRSLDSIAPDVEAFGRELFDCWKRGGKVMFAGNGGSCADAMHFAEELSVRFHKNRRALAAISLTDASAMTCCGNDFGFDDIFARQVDALGKPGDVFVGLSTSGNSPNILRALDMARSRGVRTVALAGKGGGKLKGTCDVEIIVPSDTTARIQEVHKLLFHALCVWIDDVAETI